MNHTSSYRQQKKFDYSSKRKLQKGKENSIVYTDSRSCKSWKKKLMEVRDKKTTTPRTASTRQEPLLYGNDIDKTVDHLLIQLGIGEAGIKKIDLNCYLTQPSHFAGQRQSSGLLLWLIDEHFCPAPLPVLPWPRMSPYQQIASGCSAQVPL